MLSPFYYKSYSHTYCITYVLYILHRKKLMASNGHYKVL